MSTKHAQKSTYARLSQNAGSALLGPSQSFPNLRVELVSGFAAFPFRSTLGSVMDFAFEVAKKLVSSLVGVNTRVASHLARWLAKRAVFLGLF